MSSVSTFGAFTMAKLGIYASQKAMQVTGNNITNVNTVGYTRQQLDLQSLYIGGADRYSSKWDMKVGSGVISTGVSQIRSPYLDIRYRVEQSNVGMIEKKLEGLNELSRIFDEVGDGTHDEGVMEAALQGLIEQLEYYSSEGAGKEEFDTIVKGMSKELVSIFNDYARRLEKEYDTKVSEFKQDVTKVNTILDGIRKLNNSIRKAEIHGSNALELKDERNLLIDELSKYVRIDVIYEEEDVGAGYMVDKLVIKLDGNDPKSGNDGATLIDGKYATQLRVDDFLKDDGAIAGSNFDVTLEALRDITGRAKTLNGYYTSGEIEALADVPGKLEIGGFEATIPAGVTDLADQLQEFVDQFNAAPENAGWKASVVDGKEIKFEADPDAKIFAEDLPSLEHVTFVEDPDAEKVPYFEVDLSDNDLYGALQASRETLTEKGEFSTEADTIRDPGATSKRGIPYYQKIWDAMAIKFATVLNDANTLEDGAGDLKKHADGSYIVQPENYYLTNKDGEFVDAEGKVLKRVPSVPDANDPNVPAENPTPPYSAENPKYKFVYADGTEGTPVVRDQFQGGVLFSSSGDNDSTKDLNAKNIAISHSWSTGAVGVMQSRTDSPYVETTQNSNLRHMVSILKDNNYSYKPGESDPEWVGKDANDMGTEYFNGSFAGMLTKIASTLGEDTKDTQARLVDAGTTLNELAIDRDSVSGVDLNDEAISMMQYNKSYSAACRLMTTLDEMLDKLINGTAL